MKQFATPPLHCAAIPMYSLAYSIVQTPHSSSRQTLPTCRGLLVLLISTMITLTTMLRIITSIMMLTTIAFIGKPFASVISVTELSNYTVHSNFCSSLLPTWPVFVVVTSSTRCSSLRISYSLRLHQSMCEVKKADKTDN